MLERGVHFRVVSKMFGHASAGAFTASADPAGAEDSTLTLFDPRIVSDFDLIGIRG